MPRRYLRLSDDDMRAHIDKWFAARPRTTRESVSHLVSEIRMDGVSFPTNHTLAMDEFERLGYTLHSATNEYGSLLRTYVLRREA